MSGSPFIRICGLLLLSLGGWGYIDESSSIRSGKFVAPSRAQTLKPSIVMSSGPLSGLSVLGRTCTCCIIRLDRGRAEEKKYSNQGHEERVHRDDQSAITVCCEVGPSSAGGHKCTRQVTCCTYHLSTLSSRTDQVDK